MELENLIFVVLPNPWSSSTFPSSIRLFQATEAESSTPETQVQLAFARHVLTGIEDGGLRFVDRNLLQNNLHSLKLTVCPWK